MVGSRGRVAPPAKGGLRPPSAFNKAWSPARPILGARAYKMDIQLIQNDNNPTLDNAWLSGFSDSEGCFTVSVIKRSESYNQVQVRYILSQKNELELMTKIAALFDGKVTYLKSYDGYNMTVNLSKLRKVISYFNIYSLKTGPRVARDCQRRPCGPPRTPGGEAALSSAQ
jgi:hypothetical protein